mmetsp:Transcript_81637/g.253728  ORF Transcript_81637/g.253728 Transcript_81637/m.253728 type:complete len:332 (-) Transcript_81637:1230-2225(-)
MPGSIQRARQSFWPEEGSMWPDDLQVFEVTQPHACHLSNVEPPEGLFRMKGLTFTTIHITSTILQNQVGAQHKPAQGQKLGHPSNDLPRQPIFCLAVQSGGLVWLAVSTTLAARLTVFVVPFVCRTGLSLPEQGTHCCLGLAHKHHHLLQCEHALVNQLLPHVLGVLEVQVVRARSAARGLLQWTQQGLSELVLLLLDRGELRPGPQVLRVAHRGIVADAPFGLLLHEAAVEGLAPEHVLPAERREHLALAAEEELRRHRLPAPQGRLRRGQRVVRGRSQVLVDLSPRGGGGRGGSGHGRVLCLRRVVRGVPKDVQEEHRPEPPGQRGVVI